MLKSYRRHSIVVILISAAIITPPDVISQILIAMPDLCCYEAEFRLRNVLEKKRAFEAAQDDIGRRPYIN